MRKVKFNEEEMTEILNILGQQKKEKRDIKSVSIAALRQAIIIFGEHARVGAPEFFANIASLILFTMAYVPDEERELWHRAFKHAINSVCELEFKEYEISEKEQQND